MSDDWASFGFSEDQADALYAAYTVPGGTKAFIEGLSILAKYHKNGLDGDILHAEHAVILIYVTRWDEVSFEDALQLASLGIYPDEEFGECWRYNTSL